MDNHATRTISLAASAPHADLYYAPMTIPLGLRSLSEIAVFSGSAHPALAAEICTHLEVPLLPSRIERYANDCLGVQLQANCRERDVFIIDGARPRQVRTRLLAGGRKIRTPGPPNRDDGLPFLAPEGKTQPGHPSLFWRSHWLPVTAHVGAPLSFPISPTHRLTSVRDVLCSRPSAKRQTVRSSTRASVQLVR